MNGHALGICQDLLMNTIQLVELWNHLTPANQTRMRSLCAIAIGVNAASPEAIEDAMNAAPEEMRAFLTGMAGQLVVASVRSSVRERAADRLLAEVGL